MTKNRPAGLGFLSDDFLTSARFFYSLDSEGWAEHFIDELFRELIKRYDEEVVRKMFAPYGRVINNKDRTFGKNVGLVLQLVYMDKPSITELARIKAGNGKNSAAKIESWRQQIHRALNKGDVVDEVRKLIGESPDEDFLRDIRR